MCPTSITRTEDVGDDDDDDDDDDDNDTDAVDDYSFLNCHGLIKAKLKYIQFQCSIFQN